MVIIGYYALERQNVRDIFSWSHDNGTRLLPGTTWYTMHLRWSAHRNRGVFLDEAHFFQLVILSPVRLRFPKLQPCSDEETTSTRRCGDRQYGNVSSYNIYKKRLKDSRIIAA